MLLCGRRSDRKNRTEILERRSAIIYQKSTDCLSISRSECWRLILSDHPIFFASRLDGCMVGNRGSKPMIGDAIFLRSPCRSCQPVLRHLENR